MKVSGSFSIRVAQKELLTALHRVEGGFGDKNDAHVGFQAQEERLTVMASDRNLTAFATAPCHTTESGTIFVPARLFLQVVKELPAEEIVITVRDQAVHLTSSDGKRFHLKTPLVSQAMWIEPPSLEGSQPAAIPAAEFGYISEQILFCIEQDASRNYGSVAFVHPVSEGLRVVGSDGFRLSYGEVSTSIGAEAIGNGFCLTKRSFLEIIKLCRESTATIGLTLAGEQKILLVQSPDTALYFRIVAIQFPDYGGVIPNGEGGESFRIARSQLVSAMRRLLLTADKAKAMSFSVSADQLEMATRIVGKSESKELLDIADSTGARWHLTLNGKHFWDIANTAKCDYLIVTHFPAEDRVLIVPDQEIDRCRTRHVLVPIRDVRNEYSE